MGLTAGNWHVLASFNKLLIKNEGRFVLLPTDWSNILFYKNLSLVDVERQSGIIRTNGVYWDKRLQPELYGFTSM